MTIPVTIIWSTLNRFISSILDLELEIGKEFFDQISDVQFPFSRPLWSRCDETTLKFSILCSTDVELQMDDLPTLSVIKEVD